MAIFGDSLIFQKCAHTLPSSDLYYCRSLSLADFGTMIALHNAADLYSVLTPSLSITLYHRLSIYGTAYLVFSQSDRRQLCPHLFGVH